MKKAVAAILCFCAGGAQAMKADRWVTFKTATVSGYGRVEHQIDRTSIKQEGPYKTFTTRIWLPAERQQLTFSRYEQIFFEWQKFAVDCTRGQFGSRLIDSNNPKAVKTRLDAMRWVKLDKMPAVAGTVCGKK
jgi:hypothetical protein